MRRLTAPLRCHQPWSILRMPGGTPGSGSSLAVDPSLRAHHLNGLAGYQSLPFGGIRVNRRHRRVIAKGEMLRVQGVGVVGRQEAKCKGRRCVQRRDVGGQRWATVLSGVVGIKFVASGWGGEFTVRPGDIVMRQFERRVLQALDGQAEFTGQGPDGIFQKVRAGMSG